MPVDVLLGLQWGDEGKGKVVDVFSPQYDIVARFQGGPNAGHTIVFNEEKFVLHLIPSGIFHKHTQCLIGNGVVIDPITLKKELDALTERDPEVLDRLLISQRAHLILPTHKLLDKASEHAKGAQKIGSTLRGIGPTYMDRTGRNGLRVGDVMSASFDEKYKALKQKHQKMLDAYYDFDCDLEAEEDSFFEAIEFLRSLKLINSEAYLHRALAENKNILAEGAQGTLLDITLGSYPFVTSSNTTSSGACSGLGIPPQSINKVFGIFKAYCTRVGSGPFPTELEGDDGEALRKAGHEFGATTGRPRRTGWLDLPLLKYAIAVNGVTDLIMTKADVLSFMDEIKVCYAYEVQGVVSEEIPFRLEDEGYALCYNDFPSWKMDITQLKAKEELPAALATYLNFLEENTATRISYLSVGPGRKQIFEL